MGPAKPKAVLFDLLTALLDSWTLWNDVAGNAGDGRRWRMAYLNSTYREGRYRPYESLVREAAQAVGLPTDIGDRLAARYGELAPWPEVGDVVGALQGKMPLGVVTNCSEALGRLAAARTGIVFDVIVTAERAGFYKPHPRPYRLALDELRVAPEACLFVAGSAYDLSGAAAVGLPVFWHDRVGMAAPPDAPPPLMRHASLHPLQQVLHARAQKAN
jgi:2-haloalkanoic acid dehalogenase type II